MHGGAEVIDKKAAGFASSAAALGHLQAAPGLHIPLHSIVMPTSAASFMNAMGGG